MPSPALPRSGSQGGATEPFRPMVFNNYYLLEQVAFGGMAQIYRAKSHGASGFERELVLKRVLSNLVSNPEFLQMLTNEAKLTAMLNHGNIAQVYELGLHEGVYYITMEFVEGVPLKDLIRDARKQGKPITVAEACYCAVGMLAGLDYAHRKTDWMGKPLGIVHCDVSPDNVVISYDGVVKVLDFGIARAAGAFSNYKEGMVMGKFNYVAPEQAMGGPVDARTDIFSTGIVLYELLTGEHPFGRKGDVNTLIRIARFEKGEITPPRQINADIPPPLEAIVMKALSNQKSDRWPSAKHMEVELLRFLHPETPSQIQPRISARLAELYKDRIDQRRAIRSKDGEVMAQLHREHATGGAREEGAPASTRAPAAAKKGGLPVAVAAGAAIVLGAAGFFAGKATAPAAPGAAVVVSSVAKAKVAVEHAPVGVAPQVVPGLKPGRPYLVEVSADGYKTWSTTFEAEAGKTTLLEAKLEPK